MTLEFYPIVIAVKLLGKLFANYSILFKFYTDNEALVSVINKQTSKDSTVVEMVHEFQKVAPNGDVNNVIQFSDVSFSRNTGKLYQVNVCFKNFKHNSSGQPTYISFSHGPCKTSAVDALVQYLEMRKGVQGPLFILNIGPQLTKALFNTTLQKCLLTRVIVSG